MCTSPVPAFLEQSEQMETPERISCQNQERRGYGRDVAGSLRENLSLREAVVALSSASRLAVPEKRHRL